MKRNSVMIELFLAVVFVTTMIVFSTPYPTMAFEESTWDTTFNIMYLSQEGTSVTGEYIYDDGYVTGTMEGQDLKGWWREAGNVKECGPGNAWSGPLVFRFANDWLSFKGDWGYCNQGIDDLDPDNPGRAWNGTRRDNDYFTEEECVAAGRYWCSGICQIEACDTDITQEECEEAGKIWCNGACQIEACVTTTTSVNTTTSTTPVDTTTTTIKDCDSFDTPCGDDCCLFNESCCGSFCCNKDWSCCVDRCCVSFEQCCGGSCCNKDRVCCGGKCCAEDEICSPSQECVFSIIKWACSLIPIYGEDSEEVKLLRTFRDEVLSQSPVGREIIELYYQWSPAIAKAMEEDAKFRQDVKEMIDGVLMLMGGVE